MFRQILSKYSQKTALDARIFCATIISIMSISATVPIAVYFTDTSNKKVSENIRIVGRNIIPTVGIFSSICLPEVTIPVGLAIIAADKFTK